MDSTGQVYDNAVALSGRTSKKINNNTYARFVEDSGAVAIRLYDTDIVTVMPDGDIILNSGGWRTPTTKDRINFVLECLFGSRYDVPFDIPFSVWQERNAWYVVQYIPDIAWRELPRYKFADGLTIRADLSIDGAAIG